MYLCTAIKLVHKIGLWCNGNTADFGSVIRGSNPCRPTTFIIIFKNLELEDTREFSRVFLFSAPMQISFQKISCYHNI